MSEVQLWEQIVGGGLILGLPTLFIISIYCNINGRNPKDV